MIRQTCSLGALVLYSILTTFVVNSIFRLPLVEISTRMLSDSQLDQSDANRITKIYSNSKKYTPRLENVKFNLHLVVPNGHHHQRV